MPKAKTSPMPYRKEYLTVRKPFFDLNPGDRIVVSYGIVTVTGVEFSGNHATVHIEGQRSITWHLNNWPEVVRDY